MHIYMPYTYLKATKYERRYILDFYLSFPPPSFLSLSFSRYLSLHIPPSLLLSPLPCFSLSICYIVLAEISILDSQKEREAVFVTHVSRGTQKYAGGGRGGEGSKRVKEGVVR